MKIEIVFSVWLHFQRIFEIPLYIFDHSSGVMYQQHHFTKKIFKITIQLNYIVITIIIILFKCIGCPTPMDFHTQSVS